MTNTDFGVYVEGAEETIEMFERGQLTQEQLYSTILDLDVVYRSKDEITGKQKTVESKEEDE